MNDVKTSLPVQNNSSHNLNQTNFAFGVAVNGGLEQVGVEQDGKERGIGLQEKEKKFNPRGNQIEFAILMGLVEQETETINGKPTGIDFNESDAFVGTLLEMAGVSIKSLKTTDPEGYDYDFSRTKPNIADIKGLTEKDCQTLASFLNKKYGKDTAAYNKETGVLEIKITTLETIVSEDFNSFLQKRPDLVEIYQQQSQRNDWIEK